MGAIARNLEMVCERIRAAERAARRPAGAVQLLAVAKTWPVEAVREAADAGQRAFGENYAQEGCAKVEMLAEMGLVWHFIGPLQSNKTRQIALHFDWVHSVERLKIAQRLSAQRADQLPPLNVCIQVNVSGEESKSGVAPHELPALAREVVELPRLVLRGLMCIPEPTTDAVLLRSRFRRLADLRDEMEQGLGMALDTLSMGMSDDLELAVAEGSTLVRVGAAIFGSRVAGGRAEHAQE